MTKRERNILVKKLKRLRWETVDLLAEAFNELNKMPEIVRCRECKHHKDEELGMVFCPKVIGSWVPDNWFCADGERRG